MTGDMASDVAGDAIEPRSIDRPATDRDPDEQDPSPPGDRLEDPLEESGEDRLEDRRKDSADASIREASPDRDTSAIDDAIVDRAAEAADTATEAATEDTRPSPAISTRPTTPLLSPHTLRQRNQFGELQGIIEEPSPPPIPTPTTPRRPPPTDTDRALDRRDVSAISQTHLERVLAEFAQTHFTALENRIQELESQLALFNNEDESDKRKKLMPLIDEILSSLTPTALRQETIRSLIPVIDRVISERAAQNRGAMSEAIAELVPLAIERQVQADPHAIANAVAPEMAEALRRQISLKKGVLAEAISSEMGEAIRGQIAIARDDMIDALYPVIGNTITKYMSEEIRNINAKVEQSFSFEGITRKARARLQGVSEAELILRDASTFSVKAAFLIHKESGLVIAETQQPNTQPLEADMIGGMLTAIRSFANDCIAQADAGVQAELNEIEYDTFKLVLEVAGYCYVALVIKGEITKSYVNHMRLVMTGLVQQFGQHIKDFDGDPSAIPAKIPAEIATLVPDPLDLERDKAKASKNPPALLVVLAIALLGGLGLWARQAWLGRVERTVLQKIDAIPELTAYSIGIDATGNRLVVSGELPYRELQDRLIEVVTPIVPDREVVDRTQLATFEPDDATIEAEVDRLTALLNRTLPATVVTQYADRRVTLRGWAEDTTVLQAIGQAVESVPGVRSVSSALLIDAPPDKIRLYFELGQTDPIAIGKRKLDSIERFLQEFPDVRIAIVGHADRIGTEVQNRQLARARADRIRQLLVDRGIAGDRLQARGSLELPPGISPQQPLDLSRCVRFEIADPDNTDKD